MFHAPRARGLLRRDYYGDKEDFLAHAEQQRRRSLTHCAAPALRDRLRGFGMVPCGVDCVKNRKSGGTGRQDSDDDGKGENASGYCLPGSAFSVAASRTGLGRPAR